MRRDGKWVGAITLDGGGRKVFYGGTRKEVDAKLGTLKEAQRKGLPIAGAATTLGQFVPTWLDTCRVAGKRPKTLRGYERIMRLHVVPTLGRIQLAKLTAEHIERLYATKLETLEETTVHHIHAVLHRCLEIAVRKSLVFRNVADQVDAPAIVRREITTLSEDEWRRFIDAVAGDRLEALHITAVTTGMRLAELLGMRWRDVDLATRKIKLRTTLEKYHGEITFAEPKTKGSRRNIDLVADAVESLRRHRVAQARERIAAGTAWSDLDLVFANEVGEPIADQSFRRAFHAFLKVAGCPEIRIHDGRHTAATILLGRGVHPKIVSEMLGHSRISTTMDLYSHVTPTMQHGAILEMEKALGGQG